MVLGSGTEKLDHEGTPVATPRSPRSGTGPMIPNQYRGPSLSICRMSSTSRTTVKPLAVEIVTGACRVTSIPLTGRRSRVCCSMGCPCGSRAIAEVSASTERSGFLSVTKGTSVRGKSGSARTSTAMRPLWGIRAAIASPGSVVPSGSTSITISKPGLSTSPGMSAFADLVSEPSSTSVGIGACPPSISTACTSASPWKNVARTVGISSPAARGEETNTRSRAGLSARSGTGYLDD